MLPASNEWIQRCNKLKFQQRFRQLIRMPWKPGSSWGAVVGCPRPGVDLGMAWMISQGFSQPYITTIP